MHVDDYAGDMVDYPALLVGGMIRVNLDIEEELERIESARETDRE